MNDLLLSISVDTGTVILPNTIPLRRNLLDSALTDVIRKLLIIDDYQPSSDTSPILDSLGSTAAYSAYRESCSTGGFAN